MKYSSENHNWDLTIQASSNLMAISRIIESNKSYSFSTYTGSMFLAVAGLESFLNSMAYFIDEKDFCYDSFERDTIEQKLNFFMNKFNIKVNKGTRPYQTIKEAIKWRNSLSHSKTIYVEETEICNGTDIRKLPEKCLSTRKYEPYEKSVNKENADRFNRDIIEVIRKIIEISGINPRAQASYKLQ